MNFLAPNISSIGVHRTDPLGLDLTVVLFGGVARVPDFFYRFHSCTSIELDGLVRGSNGR